MRLPKESVQYVGNRSFVCKEKVGRTKAGGWYREQTLAMMPMRFDCSQAGRHQAAGPGGSSAR
jgi:hypothetical protein